MPHLDQAQVRRAAIALKTIAEKEKEASSKATLIETPTNISVQFALRKIPEKGRNKPVFIKIPHSLRDDSSSLEMCLIVKDDKKAEIKEWLAEEPIPGLTKVMSIKKLRTNFARFEDRRKLADSYDIFLTDDCLVPSLSKVLGKVFFQRKKQPVPVKIAKAGLKRRVEDARDGTFLFMSQGPCISARMAHSLMDVSDIVENIIAGVDVCIEKIPRKWKNIQAIHLKTPDSIALPIYNASPDPTFKISLTAATTVDDNTSAETEETTRSSKRKAEEKVMSTEDDCKKVKK